MAKKKTVAKKGAKSAKSKEMLVVSSKVREYLKGQGCLTSGELLSSLNDKVHCILDGAVCRAKANKRSTVKSQDV